MITHVEVDAPIGSGGRRADVKIGPSEHRMVRMGG